MNEINSSKGVLIFAHNNEEIEYGSIALANAILIKHYLSNIDICLVTDEGTFYYLKQKYGDKLVETHFNKIVFTKSYLEKDNKRMIRDTLSTEKVLKWYNCNRIYSYDFSPYDETLVLDSDYLIFNDNLKYVFDNKEDFLINSKVTPLVRDHTWFLEEERVNFNSIEQYWATAFYFRKNTFTKAFFDFCKHVYDNYDYYRILYNTKGKTYRNDHLFSIAIHTFSGLEKGNFKPLPIPYILTAPDYDELINVKNGEGTFLVVKPKETYDFFLTKTVDTNIHIMNKQSIVRQIPNIIKYYVKD